MTVPFLSLSLLAALAGQPTTGDYRAVPATTLVVPAMTCDVTLGCSVQTPPGELISQSLATDSRMQITVSNPGAIGVGTVKITPSTDRIEDGGSIVPLRAEVDITAGVRTYRVVVTADRSLQPHVLAFVYPPPAPPVTQAQPQPVSTSEYAFLDPATLDFGYASSGPRPCVTVFVITTAAQLWCRLPDSVDVAPGAYAMSNGNEIPVNIRLVAKHYLAIDGTSMPMKLLWGDGTSVIITRTHE